MFRCKKGDNFDEEKNLKMCCFLPQFFVGMLVGFWVAGKIVDTNTIEGNVHSWDSIWMFPAIFAVVVLVIFALLFKNEKIAYKA